MLSYTERTWAELVSSCEMMLPSRLRVAAMVDSIGSYIQF